MDTGLECESLIEEVVVGVGSGLVGLHLESTYSGSCSLYLGID